MLIVQKAIRTQAIPIIRHLLKRNAALLHRESATGRTPLETAHASYAAALVSDTPSISRGYQWRGNAYRSMSIVNRAESSFAVVASDPDSDAEESQSATYMESRGNNQGDGHRQRSAKVYRLCEKFAHESLGDASSQSKRIRISLNEANEVARRLAARVQEQQHGRAEALQRQGSQDNDSVDGYAFADDDGCASQHVYQASEKHDVICEWVSMADTAAPWRTARERARSTT